MKSFINKVVLESLGICNITNKYSYLHKSYLLRL